MKMTRWIKDVIWLLAISLTCTLGAVIHQSEPSSSTPQISASTVHTVEQIRDRSPIKAVSETRKISTTDTNDTSLRNEKAQSNSTAIGESIKMVASQLLHSNKTPPSPSTSEKQGEVTDTRTPPFVKNQQVIKNKGTQKPVVKNEEHKPIENSHAGIAFPISHDEIEKEIVLKIQNNKPKPIVKETTTTSEGLSTWVIVNSRLTPTTLKPETKNKDGNVYKNNTTTSLNKETKKPAVNKPKPTPKPTRSTATPQIKPIFIRKPVAISSNKSDLIASGSAVNEKEMNKIKASVLANVQKNAALGKTTTSGQILVASTTEKIHKAEEVKETSKEIMIKINQSNLKDRKKTENKEKQDVKDNKITTVDTEEESDSLESKHAEIELPVSTPAPAPKLKSKKKKNKNRRRKPSNSNKLETKEDDTKDNKKVKDKNENTTDIYNFLSRKVIPSVGIGLVSLAGLVGLASYFFNPFATLRRSDNLIERKDIYHYNEDHYGDEGGQREEDVLGSLFPDIPVDNRIQNPNVRQNPNRYPVNPSQFTYPKPKNVPSSTEQNIRYRNVGYASEANNFVSNDRIGPKSPDIIQGTAYSENIHYDTHSTDNREPYAVYPQPQPVYKSPDRQVDNSEYDADVYHSISSYSGHHLSEPTYGQPLRYNQEMFETTKSPLANVIHLNEEDVIEHQKETGYTVDALTMNDDQEPQFVVGNVPKELIQATPVTVPEHGPRSLRIRRSINENKPEPRIESAAESLKHILDSAPKNNEDEMSNEIDDIMLNTYKKNAINSMQTFMNSYRNETFENYPNEENSTSDQITENSSTVTQSTEQPKTTATESTKPEHKETASPVWMTTSTTTTIPIQPEEYPPYNYHEHKHPILDFVRGFLDFKLRLGISILKATSDNLSRYLKDVENHFNETAPPARSRFR